MRLVKGANLAMEKVDAKIHGWQQTPWPSKLATDTNHSDSGRWALTPEHCPFGAVASLATIS